MKLTESHCLVLRTRIYTQSNENDGLALGYQSEL